MCLRKIVKYCENAFVCLVECSKKLQFDTKPFESWWMGIFMASICKLTVILNDKDESKDLV
jgi:hypothetical protein